MKHWIPALLVLMSVAAARPAFAQSAGGDSRPVEISIIPGGYVFFTENTETNEPSFGNYTLGGAVAVNFSRFVGVEGEVSGAIGVSQNLQFAGVTADRTSPHMLNYTGNVVVSAPNHSSVVPYVTGGIGGLSVFDTADLGITQTETFLTGNVGGGIKWYAGRWGLRADYRFIGVQSKDDAPAFFGQKARYGHRVYGGVVVNVGH